MFIPGNGAPGGGGEGGRLMAGGGGLNHGKEEGKFIHVTRRSLLQGNQTETSRFRERDSVTLTEALVLLTSLSHLRLNYSRWWAKQL